MPNLPAARLDRLSRDFLSAMGCGEDEITEVARHLVDANATGHDSHGVGMFPSYVRQWKLDLLRSNRTPTLALDLGGLLVFDGDRGFGQWIAMLAMRAAIERAREIGACVMILRNSGHIGRVGTYVEQSAASGMASVHFVNGGDHPPYQAPWGCSDARLGTNPVAMGVPGPDGAPSLLLDMATSTIAFGKARVARNKGEPVPEDSLLDAGGRPTNDPVGLVDRNEGALRAFGRHKGSGLAVMCEAFSAMADGMTITQPWRSGIVNNMLTAVVDASRFGDPAERDRRVDSIKGWIKASPPAPGFEEVLLPGEPEQRMRSRRLAEGIPVDAVTLEQLRAAGRELGLADQLAAVHRDG